MEEYFTDVQGPPDVGVRDSFTEPSRIVRISLEVGFDGEEVFLGFTEKGTNVRIQGVETAFCALEPKNRVIKGSLHQLHSCRGIEAD